MIKYIIHPDYVVSKSDGNMVFISYSQLINLYNLCIDECVQHNKSQGLDTTKAVHLYPLYEGNYAEMLKIKEIIHENNS